MAHARCPGGDSPRNLPVHRGPSVAGLQSYQKATEAVFRLLCMRMVGGEGEQRRGAADSHHVAYLYLSAPSVGKW